MFTPELIVYTSNRCSVPLNNQYPDVWQVECLSDRQTIEQTKSSRERVSKRERER